VAVISEKVKCISLIEDVGIKSRDDDFAGIKVKGKGRGRIVI